jgi:hypothetical protein
MAVLILSLGTAFRSARLRRFPGAGQPLRQLEGDKPQRSASIKAALIVPGQKSLFFSALVEAFAMSHLHLPKVVRELVIKVAGGGIV